MSELNEEAPRIAPIPTEAVTGKAEPTPASKSRQLIGSFNLVGRDRTGPGDPSAPISRRIA